MSPIKSLVVCSFLACTALSASAADTAPYQKGPVAEACTQDVKTLCPEVKPGEGRIAACLKDNHDKVSAGCKEALKSRHHQRQPKRAKEQAS